MKDLTLAETIIKFPILAKEINSVADAVAAYRMMKNTYSKEEYFKAIATIVSQYGGIYDSFEKKFMKWVEVNKITKEISIPEINVSGFISERSIKKKSNCIYLKLFYSTSNEQALIEFDRLNNK